MPGPLIIHNSVGLDIDNAPDAKHRWKMHGFFSYIRM